MSEGEEYKSMKVSKKQILSRHNCGKVKWSSCGKLLQHNQNAKCQIALAIASPRGAPDVWAQHYSYKQRLKTLHFV